MCSSDLESRLEVGMDENDCAGLSAVANLAGELTVDVEFVAKLAGIVGHGNIHGITRFSQSAAGRIAVGSIVWPPSVSW